MEIQDKGGHAVATVEVPAHSQEIIIAKSPIDGCAIAAVQAWDAVKGEGDADFAHAAGAFQRDLIYAAEAVYQTGKVLEGDSSLAKFEAEVLRIKTEQAKAKQPVVAPEEPVAAAEEPAEKAPAKKQKK